jgi:hypothetical protein
MNNMRQASRNINTNKDNNSKKGRNDFFRNEPRTPPKRQPPQVNMLAVIGLFFIIFLAFSTILTRNVVNRPSANRPLYSLIQNSLFSERKETSQLKTPFYVRTEYESVIRSNPLSIKEIE